MKFVSVDAPYLVPSHLGTKCVGQTHLQHVAVHGLFVTFEPPFGAKDVGIVAENLFVSMDDVRVHPNTCLSGFVSAIMTEEVAEAFRWACLLRPADIFQR